MLEHLARQPLQGPALEVPHGHVVADRVAGNRVRRLGGTGPVHRTADDQPELGLPVDPVADRRERQVVIRPHQRLGELGEQGRVLRQFAAGFLDVRAVVQADADHLGRAGHDRREVGLGHQDRSGAGPGGDSAGAALGGKQRADVRRVKRGQGVAVESGGRRSVSSADSGESHRGYSSDPARQAGGSLPPPVAE